jgi:hypothetical protein
MAKVRERIPNPVKERLLAEAGSKCANPGCHTRRVEFHHIREWAVWGTNEEAHLIVLCPTCHDAAHHGRLKIDDVMLYHWKTFKRSQTRTDVLQVEGGGAAQFYVATSAVRSEIGEANVIDLSEGVYAKYRLDEDEFFLVQLSIQDARGQLALRINDNRVVHSGSSELQYHARPGRIQVTCTSPENFIPSWLPKEVAEFDQKHAWRGGMPEEQHFQAPFTLFDIEVVAPSQVRIFGVLCSLKAAVYITSRRIYLAGPSFCSGVSGYGQFILRTRRSAFCASSSRTSYYRALGGGAIWEIPT